MSSCCSSDGCNNAPPKKYRCPASGGAHQEVSVRTILHHLNAPWDWEPTAKQYYFCGDPECEVAYFGDDDSVILKSRLRTRIGLKEQAEDSLLCYCFGVGKIDSERTPATREFVMAQTKAGLCSCETSNPAGRCCLKDFPKTGR